MSLSFDESGWVSSWVAVDRVMGRVRRVTLSLNSAEGLRSGFCTGTAEAVDVGWSTEKVNCMRLIVPGRPLRLASRERSFSAARCLMMSVEWLRLKPGASNSSMLLEHAKRNEGEGGANEY